MLVVYNVGDSQNTTTVTANGTSSRLENCATGYDGCYSACMRTYNLASGDYVNCCSEPLKSAAALATTALPALWGKFFLPNLGLCSC